MEVSAHKLRLERYFLPEFSFKAKPAIGKVGEDAREVTPGNLDIRTMATREEDKWTLGIVIRLPEEKATHVSFHVMIVGIFTADSTMKDPEKNVRINGFSILYSAAREVVRQLTSFGPYPRVYLPVVSFGWDHKDSDPPVSPSGIPGQSVHSRKP